MIRSRRTIASFLLLIGLQFSLSGQSSSCLPSGQASTSAISAAPSTSHSSHQGTQHHQGEHIRQHCLTSVICLQLPSPDTAVTPFVPVPVFGQERLALHTFPRSQSSEPTTPPPRA